MRSIRLSLIVYFLVLLSIAQGGVSWFVYQATARTLRDRQATSIHEIEAEYHTKCKDLEKALDRRILLQAQALARKARIRGEHLEPLFLAVLSINFNPQGALNLPMWVAMSVPSKNVPFVPQFLYKMREYVIEDADDIIPSPSPEKHQAQEFFQTYNRIGQIQQRSEKLGTRSLTLDKKMRETAELIKDYYDTVEPEPGWKLRLVTLKWPVTRVRPSFSQSRFPPPGTKNPGPKGPAMGRPGGPGGFEVFVQYASETSLVDKRLGEFSDERDEQAAQMVEETDETLAALRIRLFWICVATFAGIVAGGTLLIRLGLAPLARLSDAVSKVTEKDFRLKLDPNELPKELQPIAARLTGTLHQLQQAFDREKQAAADISHELRTPLAAMMATLELSLRKSRTAAEYREMLEDIRSSGAQMTHLVERLLALARLDAGAVRLRAQNIDARDVARECTNLMRPLAEAQGLALRLHAPDPVPLQADPDKLREILNNLLHNAVQYNRPEGAIDLNVVRVNGHLRLAVSDTGIGITPEQRDHIFERFYRADPSRHAESPHAGLGLAIVKSYVDLMGGTIGVDSGVHGSTFTIDLPVPK